MCSFIDLFLIIQRSSEHLISYHFICVCGLLRFPLSRHQDVGEEIYNHRALLAVLLLQTHNKLGHMVQTGSDVRQQEELLI